MAANGTKCSTNEECASGICLDEVCTDQSDPRYKLKKQTDKLNKYRQNITDNENLRDRLQEELNYLLNRARQLIPEHSRNEANIQETHREMRRVNTELRDLEEFRRNNPDIDKDEEGNNIYEFEPDEDEILSNLLPKNITTQIFKAMLENSASEQGSRMTAMDNATRNAGELVDKLTIEYNRSRQAAITKELIEIISGAESL